MKMPARFYLFQQINQSIECTKTSGTFSPLVLYQPNCRNKNLNQTVVTEARLAKKLINRPIREAGCKVAQTWQRGGC